MNYKLICLNIIFLVVILLSSCDHKSGRRNTYEKQVTSFSKTAPVIQKPQINESSSPILPLNQLFKKYQPSIFMVLTSDGEQGYQGTGFFISKRGIGVSNYHVFKGTTKGMEIIKTSDGQEFKIEQVLAQSEENDYIIFKVNLNTNIDFTPIPVALNIPEIGEDVFAIGNPYGLEHTLSRGIISGYREENTLLQTTTEITHGSSGGPLLNMQGEVVGITTAGIGEANLNFAVNIQLLELKKFISKSNEGYQPGHSYRVNVKRVIDGDTFVIETDERVRLIGIDTPETVHPRKGVEPFGPEASDFTKSMIEGKEITIEFDVEIFDRYKRLLAYAYIDNNSLNELLLLRGLAVVSTYPPNVKHTEKFLECQQYARSSKKGLWYNN